MGNKKGKMGGDERGVLPSNVQEQEKKERSKRYAFVGEGERQRGLKRTRYQNAITNYIKRRGKA